MKNFFASALFLQVWGDLWRGSLSSSYLVASEKNKEVDATGRIWEGDSVQLATKKVRLTPDS
jgi:hypothetical protein